MDEKYLIKNTTREERKQIVLSSLGLNADRNGYGSDCDGLGLTDPLETYRSYIEGEKELSEVNAALSRDVSGTGS